MGSLGQRESLGLSQACELLRGCGGIGEEETHVRQGRKSEGNYYMLSSADMEKSMSAAAIGAFHPHQLNSSKIFI
jgi:hypothetical protein